MANINSFDLVSVTEAAAMKGCSDSGVRKAIDRGELSVWKNNPILLLRQVVEDWLPRPQGYPPGKRRKPCKSQRRLGILYLHLTPTEAAKKLRASRQAVSQARKRISEWQENKKDKSNKCG